MTVTIDLDALQAQQGIQIRLADGTRVRDAAVTGEAVAGFDGIRGCELVADVSRLVGQSAPGVTVTIEQSTNGSGWSTVHAFTFTRSGSPQSFTADAPDDQLRVVCTPAGGLREAVVTVTCVPIFVDAAGGGGGGITEITSEDESVTITNPTGPTVDLSASGGGSQPIGALLSGTSIVFAVGALPLGVAFTPDGAKAYVTNSTDGTVTPITVATDTPGAPITVGTGPSGVAVTPDGTKAYVVNGGDNTVTPITVATDTPGTVIAVGTAPQAVAFSPDGTKAYVPNEGSDDVTPITVATDTPGAPITVSTLGGPAAVAFAPDGVVAYIVNSAGGSVVPITVASDTPDREFAVGAGPSAVAFSPDGTRAYVTNATDDTVSRVVRFLLYSLD